LCGWHVDQLSSGHDRSARRPELGTNRGFLNGCGGPTASEEYALCKSVFAYIYPAIGVRMASLRWGLTALKCGGTSWETNAPMARNAERPTVTPLLMIAPIPRNEASPIWQPAPTLAPAEM